MITLRHTAAQINTALCLVSGLRVQPRGVRAAGAAGGGRHAHRHTGAAQGAQVHRPGQVVSLYL